jgi:hypothetical protein
VGLKGSPLQIQAPFHGFQTTSRICIPCCAQRRIGVERYKFQIQGIETSLFSQLLFDQPSLGAGVEVMAPRKEAF